MPTSARPSQREALASVGVAEADVDEVFEAIHELRASRIAFAA